MNCPKCNDDQPMVIDSRKKPHGVHRRRECVVCGYRYSTVELDLERYKLLIAMENTTKAFVKDMVNLEKKGTK